VITRTKRWVWRICIAAVVVVVVGATLLAGPWSFLLGSVTGSTATTRYAPCLPGREVPVMNSPHISPAGSASVQYNSMPPTSGPHFAFTIATGIYSDPVPDGLTVHAMEHGHVVVQYAPDTPQDSVERLESLAKRYGKDVILAPYPTLDHGIALTAWGRLDLLEHYDEGRVTIFVENLRNRYDHAWTRADDCASPDRAR